MKTVMKVISIVLLMSLVFSTVGCQKDDGAKTAATTVAAGNVATEAADSTALSTEPVTLQWVFWGGPDEKAAVEGACAAFTELHPNITVEPMQIPNADFNAKMIALAASNELPDAGYMSGDLGETWALEGKFVNIYEQLDADPDMSKEDFLDFVWFETTPDNAWGKALAGECFGLYYNKDVLAKVGVDKLPTTAETALSWDEFVALAQECTLDSSGRNAADPAFDKDAIVQYGIMFETWNEAIYNFIAGNGGSWVSEDGTELTINSPEAVEAIQRLGDLINVYHVAPNPVAARSLPGLTVAIQNGLTAMAVMGQWGNLDLGNAKANFDIGVLPEMKQSVTIGMSGAGVIFKDSKHPAEAWELFKFMSDPTGAIDLYKNGLWMPTMTAWYTDPALLAQWVDANTDAHPAGFKEAMVDQLMNNGVQSSSFYLKNQAKLVPIVTAAWDEVWLGNKTAAEALGDADAAAKAEFQGRYGK